MRSGRGRLEGGCGLEWVGGGEEGKGNVRTASSPAEVLGVEIGLDGVRCGGIEGGLGRVGLGRSLSQLIRSLGSLGSRDGYGS